MSSNRLVLVALAALAGCRAADRTAEIPSVTGAEPPAVYTLSLDSARVYARSRVVDSNLPSLSVAVGIDGEVVWSEAFGWADLTGPEPATPETLYPAGSISKSLTATAAGLLAERGLLALDAPVGVYLPDFPEKRWSFTTRQLLGHVAGVRNYGAYDALRSGQQCEDAGATYAEMEEDTLLHEPGTEYEYSNYGFHLVGAVVRSVAGEPYLDFMDREVFEPIGMGRTVPNLDDPTAEGRAAYYERRSFGSLRRTQEIDMSCAMPAGGFLSTPTELVRFGFAMLDRRILSPETVAQFWTPQRLQTGEPTGYGMGWQIFNVALGDDDQPTRVVGHGGSVPGGRALLMIFEEHDMIVAVMTNTAVGLQSTGGMFAALFRSPLLPAEVDG